MSAIKTPKPRSEFFEAHPPPMPEEERRAERKARGQRVKRIKHGAAMPEKLEPEVSEIWVMRWQEAPPRRPNGRSKLVEHQLAMLKANPGRQALMQNTTAPNGIHKWKKRGCEATARSDGSGRWDIYVWWPA